MNKCLLVLLIHLSLCWSLTDAQAQTLNEKLIAENAARLVQDAREKGDIVRGAILFHQGNINCAKCHRPSAAVERIGPDLSRMDPGATDEYVVESILQPSKKINENFKTVTVATLDGQLFNGLLVREQAHELVIRDQQDVDRLITISRDNVDQIRPGTQSSMPDSLANELKNRQQFLDLVRYVMDVRKRGPDADSQAVLTTVGKSLSPELNGLVLIQDLNCQGCHQASEPLPGGPGTQAPRLAWSSRKLSPHYIEAFIASPHEVKPGTTMPDLFRQLNPVERAKSAKAITHYLISETQNDFRSQPVAGQSVSNGFKRFHEVGCVACHSPRNENADETPWEDSIPLGDLTGKYSRSALVEFLEDPLMVRPSGHMPDMQLTHREAIDIASYLLQSSQQPASNWDLDHALADQGKSLFVKYGCANCHTDWSPGQRPNTKYVSMKDLSLDQGCLSETAKSGPRFDLTPQARASIRAALKSYPQKLSPQQTIDVTLTSFNCTACHDRGELGGVTDQRNPHFKTTNLNLGDQGRIPPTLTGIGAKLQPKWMRDVLVNGRVVRPYMQTRMPQFGEQNIGHLVDLFQSTDKLNQVQYPRFDDQKTMRKLGLDLAGNRGLNCVACHTYQYKLSDTMPAADLTEMGERLKKNWFHQYMRAPQKFSPNTVMPSFWPGGVAIRDDLEGTTDTQIEALWQYLIDGRQASMPRGVVRERLEIEVDSEARILRRSYPGIGKRGIGVGYPGLVNLAYDAEQLRLSSIWKGKFVDPGGVWTGQGSGNVRPLGRTIEFPKGPDLDDASQPWVVDDGRPPQHQFQGYSLDRSRRPIFRYTFDKVSVEDYFFEAIDSENGAGSLHRQVSISASQQRENLSFRIAFGNQVSAVDDQTFLIDDRLTVRLVSDHAAEIVDQGADQYLRVPLSLVADQVQFLKLEYQWK